MKVDGMPRYASDYVCMPREMMGWIAPMSPRVELRIGNDQMPKACIQEIEGIGCIERDFELL